MVCPRRSRAARGPAPVVSPIEVLDVLAADGWIRMTPRVVRRGAVSVRLTDDGLLLVGCAGTVVRTETAMSVARAMHAAVHVA